MTERRGEEPRTMREKGCWNLLSWFVIVNLALVVGYGLVMTRRLAEVVVELKGRVKRLEGR